MKRVMMAAMALVVLAASAVARTSTEGERKVEERRAVKGFERIEQLGSIDVKYQQGKDFSVVVKAPQSQLKRVQTQVVGKKLVVSLKGSSAHFSWGKGDDVTVYVTSPDLTAVELKGSGDFECKTHLDTDTLNITLKGSGDVDFSDIICDCVAVSVVGSGDVELKKVVTQQTALSLVGSGDIEVRQQKSRKTTIELKGSGDVKVDCQQCGRVESRLIGSGDITLTGQVAEHKYYKRGSGDLHTKNLVVTKK